MAKNARNALGRGLSSLMDGYSEDVVEGRTTNREIVIFDESELDGEIVEFENVSRETFVEEEIKGQEIGEDEIEDIESVQDEKDLDNTKELLIEFVTPNPNQPRTNFKHEELEELSRSIKKDGLLQPILVRSMADGTYQIVAGERRWQASKLAGLEKVPVRIIDADDDKALELALIENIQRSDLNPIEEAYGYKRLMDHKKMTQADIAQAMSKGRSTVANALRLLELPEEAQQLLFEDKITAGHARAILSVPTKEGRETLTGKLLDNKMSVRETEAMARLLANKPERPAKREPLPQTFKTVAKALRNALKTNVKIKSSNGKNKIEIEFKDEEELRRLFDELIASAS